MNRITAKDLRAKCDRLNRVIFGDEDNTKDGRYFVQGADARVGGYNLFRRSGHGWNSCLYGETARDLYNQMDAFEAGYFMGKGQ